MKNTRSQNIFLIVSFCFFLALPSLDSMFDFSPIKDLFEKRQASHMPKAPDSFQEAVQYPRQLEAFFNDHYGFRKTLIHTHSKIMDKIFDESPNARVAIGKDGWLYFDNKNSLLDAQGRVTLDSQSLQRGVKSFVQNWRHLQSQHIDYLLVIAGDKSSIYPEFLPDYIKPKTGSSRADQLLQALKKQYPDFPVLDLRDILLEAKKTEKIYHETDTHWNARGAHYGYVAIMQKLGMAFHPREDFQNISNHYLQGDIASMMGSDVDNLDHSIKPKFKRMARFRHLTKEQRKDFHKPSSFINQQANLPRLFAFQDSFFGQLFPLISEHFSHSFYINEHPCQINLEVIKEYKSNVVIHQFWEGRIEDVLKSCKSKQ